MRLLIAQAFSLFTFLSLNPFNQAIHKISMVLLSFEHERKRERSKGNEVWLVFLYEAARETCGKLNREKFSL